MSELYRLSQRSNTLFGSPIGPFHHHSHPYSLPRFVHFGPQTSDESLRLAFLAGFDSRDLRGSLGLLQLIERLSLTPSVGQGLNLSFFPLIDILGLEAGVEGRDLGAAHWGRGAFPEIALLEKDARLRGYHGFIRVGEAPGNEFVTIRLRGHPAALALGVELISSEDVDPLPVRWEAEATGRLPQDGPLSVADDLPFPPFELTILSPTSWPADLHREAIASILIRFIDRYRGFQAYSQHL